MVNVTDKECYYSRGRFGGLTPFGRKFLRWNDQNGMHKKWGYRVRKMEGVNTPNTLGFGTPDLST